MFPNGQVLRSADPLRGGPPCTLRSMEPSEVRNLQRELTAIAHALSTNALTYSGPDMPVVVVSFVDPESGCRYWLETLHELDETDANRVVTQYGAEILGQRSREEIEPHWSPEYREFRLRWSRIREAIRAAAQYERGGIPIVMVNFARVEISE